MKIIHTADWHIGQNFFGYDRQTEHEHFLAWLSGQLREQSADVLLVSGDIFDVSNPSAASQRLLYRFLRKVTDENPSLQIVITAGNHDSAVRLEAPLPLLEGMNVCVIGSVAKNEKQIDYGSLVVELKNKQGAVEAFCMAVPFLRQGDYPPVIIGNDENPYSQGVKLLYEGVYEEAKRRKKAGQAIVAMGHLQATGAEIAESDHSERIIIGGLECVTPDAFGPDIAYTALGHIHKAQRVSHRENVRYAGSPLPMSFAEKKYRHGVVLADIQAGNLVSVEKLEYIPLVSLLSVPSEPQLPDDVLEVLRLLPEQTDDSLAPYLEVHVLLEEPEPSLKHRLEETLEGKQARLVRIVPHYRGAADPRTGNREEILKLEDMNPLQVAEIVYRNKYQVEMPADLVALFQDICLEIKNESST